MKARTHVLPDLGYDASHRTPGTALPRFPAARIPNPRLRVMPGQLTVGSRAAGTGIYRNRDSATSEAVLNTWPALGLPVPAAQDLGVRRSPVGPHEADAPSVVDAEDTFLEDRESSGLLSGGAGYDALALR